MMTLPYSPWGEEASPRIKPRHVFTPQVERVLAAESLEHIFHASTRASIVLA